MSPAGLRRTAIWLLPIVVFVCVLMAIPAAGAVQSHSVPTLAGSSGTSVAATPSGSNAVATPSGPSGPIVQKAPPANSFSSGLVSTATPTIPSAAPPVSNALSSDIQKLEAQGANPSTIALLERLAAGVQSGAISPRALALPNFGILSGESARPGCTTYPTPAFCSYYTQAPAPMGVADFGLGASAYEYNTSSVVGTANITSINATSGSLYEASGAYYWNGYSPNQEGSPYDWGIQLNTVVANVTFPGSSSDPLGSGNFWTQNVPDWSGNSVQFLDNVWNFSAPGATMNPGTLYSYDGYLVPYDFYYDYGPTLPVVYPVSLQLYNNASIISGRSAITYGYRLVDDVGGASQKVYTGIYDTVIFNSPSPPTIQPQFRVDGYGFVFPGGFQSFDSELVFTGPAAGSNAVITNLSGSMTLRYLPNGGTTYRSVPSAYDYGANTGETAVGVAEAWSGTTVELNQGPSLLYGLWDTPASVGVPSGGISFTAHSDPNYAFTFIGENISGAPTYPEWAPSNAAGIVNTYLPPSIPGATAYTVQAYAAEYADYWGADFSATTTNYVITMTAELGNLDSPLYMNGEAQATALVTAIDGSATVPYTFHNLGITLGIPTILGSPFCLVNDWSFPVFNLVYSTGVTSKIAVNNVYQTPNFLGGTYYFWPYWGDHFYDLPNASQQFVDYGGVGDTFTNLDLVGLPTDFGFSLGGAISLWGTSGVVASDLTVTEGSFGVWASSSPGTTVKNSNATEASDFAVIDSSGAVGWNLSSYEYGWGNGGVFAQGASGGTFTYLNASYDTTGFNGYWVNSTTVNYARAIEATAIYVDYGVGLTVNNLAGSDDASGLIGFDLTTTVVTGGTFAAGTEPGIGLIGGSSATISTVSGSDSLVVAFVDGFSTAMVSNVVADDGSLGVEISDSTGITVSNVAADSDSEGVGIEDSSGLTVTGVSATLDSRGVYADPSSALAISAVTATADSYGTEIYDSMNVSISGTSASDLSVGDWIDESSLVTDSGASATGGNSTVVVVDDSSFVTVSDVTASSTALSPGTTPDDFYAAVVTEDTTATTVSKVMATYWGAALSDFESDGLQASDVNGTSGEYAVWLEDTYNSYFTGIGAYKDWVGLAAGEDEGDTSDNIVTGSSFVADTSYGVAILGGYDNVFSMNNFIGDNGATGTYNPAHVQAYSVDVNYFNTCSNGLPWNVLTCMPGVGNYWADWHTYGSNGYLAPYVVTGTTVDL